MAENALLAPTQAPTGNAAAPAAHPFVVRLSGIQKAYHVGEQIEVDVLHGIDLTFRHSDFCVVVGPSGSGESTLLNLVGLLDRPTSGLMSTSGEETTRLHDRALTRLRGHSIGFVFPHHHLITAFTALENVMMPMLGAAGFPNDAMRARAAALIDSVGLTRRKDNLAGNLSGGQQQRVLIARALAMDPALLLADEPTSNLDSQSADEVFELLRQFNWEHGTTVLFVTHNPALAERCDKIIQVIDRRVT